MDLSYIDSVKTKGDFYIITATTGDRLIVPKDTGDGSINAQLEHVKEWLKNNVIGEEEAETLPIQLTRLQFRRALSAINKRAALQTLLNALTDYDLRDYFDSAERINRDDPEIEQIRVLGGFTNTAIDNLFAAAQNL